MLEELCQEVETLHFVRVAGALASQGASPAPSSTAVQPGGCRQAYDEAANGAQECCCFGVGLAVAPL